MDRRRHPSVFTWIAFFMSLPTLIVLVLGFVWYADSQPPISGIEGRFVGWDNHAPGQGRVLWTYRRDRDCRGVTQRWLMNGAIVSLPETALDTSFENRLPDGRAERIVTVYIPPAFEAAPRYVVRARFMCNPLHEIAPLIVDFPVIDLPPRVHPMVLR